MQGGGGEEKEEGEERQRVEEWVGGVERGGHGDGGGQGWRGVRRSQKLGDGGEEGSWQVCGGVEKWVRSRWSHVGWGMWAGEEG